MELIPIIEKSLLIFTGALVLVLTGSYLIFKLGRKNNSGESEANINPFDNRNLQPSVIIQNDVAWQQQMVYQNEMARHEMARQVEPVSGYHRHTHYTIENTPAHPVYIQDERAPRATKTGNVTKRFTVINEMPEEKHSYYPERDNSFNHRFASSKSTDAFVMFR